MRLGALDRRQLRDRLRSRAGLGLRLPPFSVRVRSDVGALADDMALMYGDFELTGDTDFCDFHVEILRPPSLRRWFKPLAEFAFDGARSFTPLPARQCFTMLEWGLNWCIAAHAHQYLLIHAATLERDGRALLLPAPPGSGKSTLCAALARRGWRLLSDELGLLDMNTGLVWGMARPINLKNASIDVIRAFAPDAAMTAAVPDTNKGTVALVRAPAEAIARVLEPARPAWVVLPRWRAGSAACLTPVERARAFMTLAEQSFNYDIHGQRGFSALGALVDGCRTFEFEYGDLDEALLVFDALAREAAP